MKSLSKELFIMALLIMIVVFMVGIIFYEYMPNNKTVPEPITYSTASTTTAVLQEIAATASDTSSSSDSIETQSIIKSYSIGSKELSTAASKQSYTSGKTDPFAEYTGTTSTTNGNTTDTNTTTTTTTQGNSSNSSSTGTFFESSNSK
ncbi:MAG: hypothetical protein J6A36_00685 [Clostridia bacterium]|nr:hypothetical protein [Clostridia bacterium]